MSESNLKAGQAAPGKSKSLATVAASATALYSISGLVSATPMVGGDSFSVSGNQSVDWDVDGNGSVDFVFRAQTGSGTSTKSFQSSFNKSNQYTVRRNENRSAGIEGYGQRAGGNTNTRTKSFQTGSTFQTISYGDNQFFQNPQEASNRLPGTNQKSFQSVGIATSFENQFTQKTYAEGGGTIGFKSGTDSFQNSFFNTGYGESPNLGGTGFLGFKVFDPDMDGESFFFGWANITIAAGNFAPMLTINNWCYETSRNTSIHVGSCEAEVPEPSVPSLILLGLGAAGIRRWRELKKQRAAA